MPIPRLERRHVAGLPDVDRPLIMGVVNVTPDSFSDGGRFAAVDDAVAHGVALAADGADILDIGGESTRPGATRPLIAEELGRVIPVIRELSARGLTVSVDTMRAEVAAAALEAGASIVNDVSGGLADAGLLRVVAEADAAYVAMHWRGHSDLMQQRTEYDDVVADVRAELAERVEAAVAAGVSAHRMAVDPGLGFAKLAGHNWELLSRLDELDLGLPILLGASRKSFLGALLADAAGVPRPVDEREAAGIAVTTMAALARVWAVRVHDVRASADAIAAVGRVGIDGGQRDD